MLALLQLNVAELPVTPTALDGVALLTLFIGPRELPNRSPNGEQWCLRTYASLDDLAPLEEPPAARAGDPRLPKGAATAYHPFGVRWSAIDDAADEPAGGLKAGGWPCTVQDELGWDADIVLQVDSDDKVGFAVGFGGLLYVGRDRATSEWVVDWQSM